jgi:hypothetical protein
VLRHQGDLLGVGGCRRVAVGKDRHRDQTIWMRFIPAGVEVAKARLREREWDKPLLNGRQHA